MNKNLILALLNRCIAEFIERTFQSKYTTIGAVLGATGVAVAQYTPLIPAKYQVYLTTAGIVCASVSGILGHDSKSTAPTAQN